MAELAASTTSFINRRLQYAWLAGGLLWAVWLISIVSGTGLLDRAGQVIGTDYLQFYAAGMTLRQGQSSRLYDIAYQDALQQAIAGPDKGSYFAFITPPWFAWPFVPLAALPYRLSFALWCLLGLGFLAAGAWLLTTAPGGAVRRFLWSLTWFPVFASVSYGQNALLSLAILSLVYRLWRRERGFWAGLVCSLVLFKPQLALGVACLWLLDWRRDWRSLAGLALGGATQAALTWWQMPAASRAYLDFAARVLPDLPHWQQFPLWNLHTVRGFWQLLLPAMPGLADALYVAMLAAALAGFVWLRRRITATVDATRRQPLLFAAAVCLTLVATPHAMIYDWALLLIPAALLWQYAPGLRARWRALFAGLWLAAFVSGPLTFAQLHLWPWAVQISVAALLAACCLAARWLARPVSEGVA